MADIDSLDIQISASVSKAEKSIDRLVVRLDALSKSLGKIGNAGNTISNLGAGVERLARGMQSFKGIGESKFSKLANSVNQLANIDSQGISNVARSLSRIAGAFQNVSGISGNTAHIAELARSLGRLGSKTATTAISNIPQLATAMRNLMDTLSRAPRVSQNLIDMTNALANLASQGSRVGTASNSIERGLNRTSASARRAKKSFGGLASVFGKFYATYFPLIRAFKGLGNSINSTADYVEAFNYYTVAFGKIASKWDEEWENYGDENAKNYANSFVTTINETFKKLSGVSFDPKTGLLSETGLENLGLNLREVTQYAAQLASMMDAVGQSGETTLATTNAFVKLAGDISSLYNIDYSEAANKIRSVLQGQSRAGYGFGWDTTMAALQATADKLDLSKAVSEMSQMEKQQLRILTILEQSRVAWGDQSNTIDTLANQIRVFKNNISEAGMVLGQLFMPILTKLMPIINGVTIAIKRLMANIAGILGIEIEDTGQGFTDMEDDIGGIADGFDDATKSAEKLNKQLAGFDELNVLSSGSSFGDLSGSVDGYIDLTEEIQKATAEYEAAWSEAYAQMESKAEEFAGKFGKTFEVIEKIVEKISEGDFKGAGEGIANIVTSILTIDSTETIEKAGEAIRNFFTAIWNAVINVDYDGILTSLTSNLASFVTSVLGIEKIDSSTLSAITGAIEGLLLVFFVKTAIDVTINGIKNALDGLRNVIGLMKAHPYTTIAAGIAAVLGAVYKYTKNQNNIAQMEIYGTTLEELGDRIEKARETMAAGKESVENAGTGEITYLKELASQYFDLYKKENLTAEETKRLQTLYDQLSEKLPGFDSIISDTTKTYEEQKKAVSELISELEKEYRTKAAENFLVEAYEKQLQLQKDEETALKMYKDFESQIAQAREKHGESQNTFWGRIFGETADYANGIKNLESQSKEAFDALWETREAQKEIENDIAWAYEQMGLEIEKSEEKSTKGLSSIGNSVSSVVSKAKEAVDSVKNFGEKLVNGSIDGINGKQSELSSSLKTVTENSLKSVPEDAAVTNASQNIGKSAVQGVIDGANSKKSALSLAFSGLANIANTVLSSINAGKTPTGRIKINTPQYATGGFPEDGLFYANHGELVGKFSNGRTAVANNEQITAGIEQAAYRGMMQAIKDSGGISGNVNVSVEADTNGLFRVVQKKANEHFKTTGNPAFMF